MSIMQDTYAQTVDPSAEMARLWVERYLRGGMRWISMKLSGLDMEYSERFEQEEFTITLTVKLPEAKAHSYGEKLRALRDKRKPLRTGVHPSQSSGQLR